MFIQLTLLATDMTKFAIKFESRMHLTLTSTVWHIIRKQKIKQLYLLLINDKVYLSSHSHFTITV